MKIKLLFATLFLNFYVSAQISPFLFDERTALRIHQIATSGTLVVVIENEKDPFDGALVKAIRNWWNLGTIKYLSAFEYDVKYRKGGPVENCLFLYEDRSQAPEKHSGKFILLEKPTSRNYDRTTSVTAGRMTYTISKGALDENGMPEAASFDLMIKYLRYELMYCGKSENFQKKSRPYRRVGDLFYFNGDRTSYQNKVLLLLPSQAKLAEEGSGSQESPATREKLLFKKYGVPPEIIHVVVAKDVETSLKKNDEKVLLFNNGKIHNAADGSVFAAFNIQKKTDYLWVIPLGCVGCLTPVILLFAFW